MTTLTLGIGWVLTSLLGVLGAIIIFRMGKHKNAFLAVPRPSRLEPPRANNQPAITTSLLLRPPLNAEYLLYLLLRKKEREVAIGDLVEEYGQVLQRFNRRRADIWFYKQVIGSLWPLLRRTLLRIGALVWLGRVLRRLIS